MPLQYGVRNRYAFILRIIYLILSFKDKINYSKAIDLDNAIDSILGNERKFQFPDLYYGWKIFVKIPNLKSNSKKTLIPGLSH